MATEDEKLATFKAIAGTDDDGFATSFLEAHDWNVETAVNSFIGGGGGGGSGGGGGGGISDADMAAAMAAEAPDPQERAPLPQFVEQLMDPAAHHLPTVSHEQQSSSVSAALEAFQNSKAEGQSGSGDGDNGDGFGQRKRPRNLAEIYRQPTELCFKGSFDQLRAEGKQSSKWLLVNIQSPTEFASQQLNADVWTDETLRAVLAASFLFWQQYYDSELGATYCRHYQVPPTALPHIGIVDPVTGQLVKQWHGFKTVEVLMDKLTQYADEPPSDGFGALDAPATPAAPSPLGRGLAADEDEDAEISAAIAASLAPAGGGAADTGAGAGASPRTGTPSPPGFAEQSWDEAPEEPPADADGVVTLAVRCPNNGRLQRRFLLTHTLRDVLCSVHHSGTMPLSSAHAYQLASHGVPTTSAPECTLEQIGLSGRVMVNISEAPL